MIQNNTDASDMVFLGFDLGKLIDKLQGWLDAFILKIPNLIAAIIVVILFWILAKYISKFIRNILMRHVRQQSIKMMMGKLGFAIIVLIGFFLALGILQLDKVLTTILAGAGVIGLAIGLALQGTLSNTFSGVMLAFLPNLQLGDWVETNGFAGRVLDISLRSVTITESDNNHVVIPNSKIVDSPFKNYSQTKRSRVFINCGVGYESDLEKVEELTINTLAEHFKSEAGEEIEFYYQEFGDSSINFVVRFWIDANKKKDILKAQNIAVKAIKKAYDANGINIPFPIRTLDFNKNKFRSETITIASPKDGGSERPSPEASGGDATEA